MTEKIQLFLNSKTANKYIDNKTSDCVFHLPIINIPKHRKVYVSVQTAMIPYSFYNVSSINNTLKYTINGGATQTLTITPGNYNVNTLITAITTDIPAFTITYNSKTNILTFSHSTYDFTLESTSTCFEVLGFEDNITYTSTSQVLTGTISLNLFTIRNVYVSSDNFQINNINNSTPNKSNILCSIPIDTSHHSMISYSNIYGVRNMIHHVHNLTNLHIKLTDQDDDVLDLNGCHFSLTLEIDIE
jgi:hypothetical protein